jgi:GT2 family glycosyltransferase
MKLAVIILNWNGIKLLEKFLPALVRYSNNKAQIYMIDNKSTDESVGYVSSNFPLINIVQNKENYGYAKGYNEGLKKIDADVYCLLNNDVEVTDKWLEPFIEEFKSNQNIAVAQPKILNYNERQYFDYAGAAGGYIDRLGFPYCDGRVHNILEKDVKQFDFNKDIFWASGACFFIRENVFKSLNGFDESFFNHMEEIDLCWRVLKQGFKIRYIYNSSVFHVGGATLDYNNPKKTFYNFRNSLISLTKNIEKNLISTIFLKMVVDGLIGVYYLITLKFLHFLAIIKAHFAFYIQMPNLIKKRKNINSNLKYYKTNYIIVKYFKLKYVKFFVD